VSDRTRKYGNLRQGVEPGPDLTEVRTYGNTEGHTEVGAELSEEASKQVRAEAREDVSTTVREAIRKQRKYQGGVKLTLEIDPALNTRAKRYLLDVPGATMRSLLTELLEAFLDGEEQ
jgi:hypothetical protein